MRPPRPPGQFCHCLLRLDHASSLTSTLVDIFTNLRLGEVFLAFPEPMVGQGLGKVVVSGV